MTDQIRAIDKLRAAYSQKPWDITLEEVGVTAYFLPFTVDDIVAIDEGKNENRTGWERSVDNLIRKARDAHGKPLFLPGDKRALMSEVNLGMVQRLTTFMYTCGTMNFDEGKQLLGEATTSGSATTSPSPVNSGSLSDTSTG